MKHLLVVTALFFLINLSGIGQDSVSMHQTAKTFIRQGDYSNAILVLNKALQSEPENFEVKKDLAFAYYLHRDYVKAIEIAKPLTEGDNADIQSYQITGLVYKAIEERKECEKMYKAAIKKFAKSGVLHNEYGEMLWSKKEFTDAVKLWEKGIEVEPNYSGNYYNAAKYYYFSVDKVWGIVYGEIFVNLESYSKRTAEIRNLLLDGYKKLFADSDMLKNQNTKNEFVKAFLETMRKNSSVVSSGVTPESLVSLRTRFVLDWTVANASRFPYRLFDYHVQLLKAGMFDAYNQWILESQKTLQPSRYGQPHTQTNTTSSIHFKKTVFLSSLKVSITRERL